MRTVYLAAVLMGVASTMLGPLMPAFESRWRLDDAEGGLLFVAQFLATVAAAPAVSRLARRFGYWRVIALGMATSALGIAACGTSSWTITLAAVAVFGCGLGVSIPAANFGIAAGCEGDSARPVVWLNFFWSIGAVAAPMLVAYLGGAFLVSVAVAFLAMALTLALQGSGQRPAKADGVQWAGLPLLFGLTLFLYVGSESAIAGWVSSYAIRNPEAQRFWAVLPSIFWGAILGGRFVAPSILARIPPAALAPAGLAVSLGGAFLLLGGSSAASMLAGSAICGLGFAPIFPLVVSAYADQQRGRAASGLIFVAAGLGGAALPPLVGWVSTASGSLRIGLATILGCMVAMLLLIRTAMPRSDRSS